MPEASPLADVEELIELPFRRVNSLVLILVFLAVPVLLVPVLLILLRI
jgi:hypothetical protein